MPTLNELEQEVDDLALYAYGSYIKMGFKIVIFWIRLHYRWWDK